MERKGNSPQGQTFIRDLLKAGKFHWKLEGRIIRIRIFSKIIIITIIDQNNDRVAGKFFRKKKYLRNNLQHGHVYSFQNGKVDAPYDPNLAKKFKIKFDIYLDDAIINKIPDNLKIPNPDEDFEERYYESQIDIFESDEESDDVQNQSIESSAFIDDTSLWERDFSSHSMSIEEENKNLPIIIQDAEANEIKNPKRNKLHKLSTLNKKDSSKDNLNQKNNIDIPQDLNFIINSSNSENNILENSSPSNNNLQNNNLLLISLKENQPHNAKIKDILDKMNNTSEPYSERYSIKCQISKIDFNNNEKLFTIKCNNKCSKSLKVISADKYFCSDCNQIIDDPLYFYRVHAIIKDDTDEMNIIIQNTTGNKLFEIPAESLRLHLNWYKLATIEKLSEIYASSYLITVQAIVIDDRKKFHVLNLEFT